MRSKPLAKYSGLIVLGYDATGRHFPTSEYSLIDPLVPNHLVLKIYDYMMNQHQKGHKSQYSIAQF